MTRIRNTVWTVLAIWMTTGLVGCGGNPDVNENKPIGEVKTESDQMNANQLRDMAMAYQETIQSKMASINDLKDQLKKIPALELMGENAKQLKQDIDTVAQSIQALRDRFKIYYDRLKDKNGDLSGLNL